MIKIKYNSELKKFLYSLVGYELTRDKYEKILDYFNQIVNELEWTKKASYNKSKDLHKYRTQIDKAIEYLENHTYDKNGECGYTPDWEVRELYDILKGSDSNE